MSLKETEKDVLIHQLEDKIKELKLALAEQVLHNRMLYEAIKNTDPI